MATAIQTVEKSEVLQEILEDDAYLDSGIMMTSGELDLNLSTVSIDHDNLIFKMDREPMLDAEGEPLKEIKCVFVAVFGDRVMWEAEYDPEDPTKLCWSVDGRVPHTEGSQYGKVKDCASCPMSKWNNKAKGKNRKPACTQQLNMIGICAEEAYLGIPFLYRCKTTSYNPAKAFLKPFVMTQRSKNPKKMKNTLATLGITEGKYGSKTYGISRFKAAELSEEMYDMLDIETMASEETRRLIRDRYQEYSSAEGKTLSDDEETAETVEVPVAATVEEDDIDV